MKKISEIHAKACHWLAEANAAEESGNLSKAEKYLEKAQRWLDKLTKAEGLS